MRTKSKKHPRLTAADLERNRALMERERMLRDEFQETLSLLYIALTTAHGGADLLDDANAILLSVVKNDLVSDAVRASIFSLVSSTSPGHAMSELGIPAAVEGADIEH
jgi:hypothetical protein